MPAITPFPDPPSREDSQNFDARADDFVDHQANVFVPEINALRLEVLGAQSAASSSASAASSSASAASASAVVAQIASDAAQAFAGISMWNAATNYTVGKLVVSPTNLGAYRSKFAGVSSVDPANDAVRWEPASVSLTDILGSHNDDLGAHSAAFDAHNADEDAHPGLLAAATAQLEEAVAESAADAFAYSVQASESAAAAAAAADAAVLTYGIYSTTAKGLAGTVDTQYFNVVSADSNQFLNLYRNVAGSAVFQKTYPSAEALGGFTGVTGLASDFNTIVDNGVYWADAGTTLNTPSPGFIHGVLHVNAFGGRAWQVAWRQQTAAGDKSREYRRYRTSAGVWEDWRETPVSDDLSDFLRRSAKFPAALFWDGSAGALYDFTDRISLGIKTTADTVVGIQSLVSASLLKPSDSAPVPTLDGGRLVLQSTTTSQQLNSQAPLLPETGDFILAWCHKATATGLKPIIWQHQTGAAGRTQIVGNSVFNGSAHISTQNKTQVFINGVVDGAGASGMIKAANHAIGQWADYVLIIRSGVKASQLWVNGELVDTFTRPASIPQVATTLFRNASMSGAGLRIGRMLVINRAPASGEIGVIRDWLQEVYPVPSPWVDPVVTSTSVLAISKPVYGFDSVEVWQKDADGERNPASMTKLMTSYVGLHWLKKLGAMNTLFVVQASDATGGSGNNLLTGDVIDVRNALANMGLPSSNVTTTVWARTIGNLIGASDGGVTGIARFVAEMNVVSASLGMANSFWGNASGLDSGGNLTTAREMILLAQRAEIDHPEIPEIFAYASWNLTITGPAPRTVVITHSVDSIEAGDKRFAWGKTGTTGGALNCLIAAVRVPSGARYYYCAFAASTDANRYVDFDAVYSAAVVGIEWPTLVPRKLAN